MADELATLTSPGTIVEVEGVRNIVTNWCLRRKQSTYVELLYVEFDGPLGQGKPLRALFSGELNPLIQTRVGVQGRRAFSTLPFEDVREFVSQASEPHLQITSMCSFVVLN